MLGLAGVLWVGLREETIALRLFVRPQRWWLDLATGLAAGALLLGLWEVLGRRLELGRELERRIRELLGALEPDQALGLALMSGFAEEVFFRGGVQGSWGYAWASLLFALLHSGRERCFLVWTAFAAVAGLLFGALVYWTGVLLPAIAAHALVNGVNLVRLSRDG